MAVLKGKVLQDQEHIRPFANYLPELTEDIILALSNGPLPDLYNVIYATMYQGQFKTNEYGYTVTNSQNISTEIWTVASDWGSLITWKENPKQVMRG